jgi:hypothetical protein
VAEAAAAAHQAHELASRHGEQGYAAGSLRMLGEIHARGDAGEAAAATGHYGDALERARALGMRPLEALCHLGQGILARRAGQGVEAKERLAEAGRLLRQMDMRYWLVQVEAEMAAL